MSTTIDSLQIEIQSSSVNAASGIDALAKSLEKLKKVGSFKVVTKNLESLSKAIKDLQAVSSAGTNLQSVAKAVEGLKAVGSFGAIGNSFSKLSKSLKDLESMNIDGVVAKIKELNDKVGPVSQKLASIGNAFKIVNSESNKTSGSIGGLGKKINTTTLNMSSMINVARGLISVLRPIINLIKNAIGDALEWEGIAQRFGRGFGNQAQETYEWIQRLNKEMGINTQQFMQYSSTYATMLKGFGVASEDASKMALGYMELTYDIWAGYNDIYKSLEDAATAVRSAIAGEVEPVRKAGFTIIESTLEQTAANHGLKISLENATEAQKSYLRYLTMVDQAQAQGLVGNYARELNTAEGVMRTFNQQLKSLGQTFGSIFLPVLVKVMPYLQAFVDLVGDIIRTVAEFYDIDIQKVTFGGSIGSSADLATDSVDKTTTALKELKNATTGIDELNIISPQSTSGGVSASGGGFDRLDVDSLWDESIFDSIQTNVNEIKDKMKEWLGITEDIDSLAELMDTRFGNIAISIGAIVGIITGVKLISGAITLYESIAKIVSVVKGSAIFAKTIEFFAAAKAVAPEVGWLAALFPKISAAISGITFKGLLSSIGQVVAKFGWVGAIIAAVIAAITYAIDHWNEVVGMFKTYVSKVIAPKIKEIKDLFAEMGAAITSAIPPSWIDWIKGAIAWLGSAIAWLWGAFGGSVFHTTMAGVLGTISGIITAIKGAIQIVTGAVQVAVGIVEAFVKAIIAIFNGNWKAVLEPLNKIWSGIKNIFFGLCETTLGTVYYFVDGIVKWFTYLWDVLVGHSIVPDTIDGIIKCFTELPGKVLGMVADFVKNVIGKFSNFGSQLVGKISSGWNSVKSWWSSKPALASVSTTVLNIKDKLVSAWNTAKTWWNNNVKLSIPSLSFKVTYSTTSLNAVQKAIVKALGLSGWPKLSFAANGGIFDAGSLVWAGESGPEVLANAGGGKTGVMNVQQMSEAVYEGVYSAVVAAMRASNGSGGGQSVNVYLDGKQITASVEQRQKERGASLMGNQVYAY